MLGCALNAFSSNAFSILPRGNHPRLPTTIDCQLLHTYNQFNSMHYKLTTGVRTRAFGIFFGKFAKLRTLNFARILFANRFQAFIDFSILLTKDMACFVRQQLEHNCTQKNDPLQTRTFHMIAILQIILTTAFSTLATASSLALFSTCHLQLVLLLVGLN